MTYRRAAFVQCCVASSSRDLQLFRHQEIKFCSVLCVGKTYSALSFSIVCHYIALLIEMREQFDYSLHVYM